ncbi:MAG TPA: hypothetical protein VFA65_19060, partial [Bryobacteraceae bacterium]|nr:hypothetical protein [Bryobacteraceae bacterium]
MDELAIVCERIASYASRSKKIALLADYLRNLDDDDLLLAVQLLSAGPISERPSNRTLFEVGESAKLSIGYSVLRAALQKA